MEFGPRALKSTKLLIYCLDQYVWLTVICNAKLIAWERKNPLERDMFKFSLILQIISNNKLETDLRIFKNDEIDNIVDFILREF